MTDFPEFKNHGFHEFLLKSVTVKRAVKVGLVVGTILIAINQGDMLLAGKIPPLWKIILTYMVPYGVSSYSTAAMLSDLSNAQK